MLAGEKMGKSKKRRKSRSGIRENVKNEAKIVGKM